jgi:hypothetical protein
MLAFTENIVPDNIIQDLLNLRNELFTEIPGSESILDSNLSIRYTFSED